jgi:hypothetical protein
MEVEYAVKQEQKVELSSDFIDPRGTLYGTQSTITGLVEGESPEDSVSEKVIYGDFVVVGRILVRDEVGLCPVLIGKISE